MNKLFEYALLFHGKQTKEMRDAGENAASKLIGDVTRVVAKDEKIAAMQAARAIPAEYADKLDQVEIVIRPF
jgi:hypothetical protein